jgi:type II secretory pathway pseudopilin PulG
MMVTVAIVGVLTTIAIPRVMSYRVRALQSEAKTHLGFIAKGEHAYYAERDAYTDDLGALSVEINGAPRYLYGFTTDATPKPSGRNDTAELKAAAGGSYDTVQMIDAFGVLLSQSDLPTAPVTATSFRLGAVGNADFDPVLDQWTIDEDGILINVTNDMDDGL